MSTLHVYTAKIYAYASFLVLSTNATDCDSLAGDISLSFEWLAFKLDGDERLPVDSD